MSDLPCVVEARVVGDHRLFLRFEDGVRGTIDLSGLRFRGVFESLADPKEFAKVTVDRDAGTVTWPAGADIDPIVLHSAITGEPIDTGHGVEYGATILNGGAL